MFDIPSAQSVLFEGWTKKADAANCLSLYLANISDAGKRLDAIHDVYKNHVDDLNKETFLQVMKHEYSGHAAIQDELREIAFEIIAARAGQNPRIVEELKFFNPSNKELVKDTIRFKLRKR